MLAMFQQPSEDAERSVPPLFANQQWQAMALNACRSAKQTGSPHLVDYHSFLALCEHAQSDWAGAFSGGRQAEAWGRILEVVPQIIRLDPPTTYLSEVAPSFWKMVSRCYADASTLFNRPDSGHLLMYFLSTPTVAEALIDAANLDRKPLIEDIVAHFWKPSELHRVHAYYGGLREVLDTALERAFRDDHLRP